MKYVKLFFEGAAFGIGVFLTLWFSFAYFPPPFENDRPSAAPATSIYPQGRPTE